MEIQCIENPNGEHIP
jgi:hypothetical protein